MKLNMKEKKILYAYACPSHHNTVTRLKWLTALTVDPEAKSQMLHLARKIETETEERWYEAFYHHLRIIIFVIVYGRMIEIYCMVSLAPIPMATFGNHEQSHMGQNYLKCLFALGFQGFLILICVAIYAVLIQSVAISGDAINSIWSIVGYTVLLCFSLFKTSSVTKSVLGAH